MKETTARRLVLATTVWKRRDLTDIVLRHYRRIQEELASRMDLTLLAVGSEGAASRDLCERNGFDYIETENEPVTYKWNAVVRHARSFDPEGVILVNSDDVVSVGLFEAYLERLSEGSDFFGLRDAFIFDVPTATLGRWPGYEVSHMQYRVGEPAGCARCFSRRLLHATDWRLWPAVPPRNSKMDFWCTQFVALFGFEPEALTMASLGVEAVQLKTDVNITPFEVLPLQEVRFGEPAWRPLEGVVGEEALRALQSLHRVFNPAEDGASGMLPDRNPSAGRRPVHRIEDLLPQEFRDQILGDLDAMRRSLEEEKRLGIFEGGVASVRVP